MSNIPSIEWDSTGPVLPSESDLLTGALADLDAAVGGGLSTTLSTPQGQIATSIARLAASKNADIAAVVNAVDPDTAYGRYQDAIGKIYFLNRIAGQGTVVTGRCYGVVGTVLPISSVAQDTNGYLYYSTTEETIGSEGYVDVQFQNSTLGEIACAIGTLTRIYTAQTGWESVNNLTAGTLGRLVETAADFEYRRKNSVAANAKDSNAAVMGAVLGVDGVLDAYVTDNPTGSSVTKGSTDFGLVAHSILVSVSGGEAADIAAAIIQKKSAGCNYNGDTTYAYEDTSSGYSAPYPVYTVRWQTAVATPTYFVVNIASEDNLPTTILSDVKSAIVAAFNGTDGGTRARIGASIYAGRYYAGVAAISDYVNIESIYLGTAASPTGTAITFGIEQRPTLDESNITVNLV